MRLSLLSLLSLALSACGPTALRPDDNTSTLSLGGDSSRRVKTLTDLEEVRGVVSVDGVVHIATDNGLLQYPSVDMPGVRIEGLPSSDIRGVVIDGDGLLVATGDTLVRYENEQVTPVEGVPLIGHLTDMTTAEDGTVWLCGLGGLARRTNEGSWETFGEPVRCTTLAPTPEGHLWVGTSQGIWYVEDDIIREHQTSGGLPEGYVRAIVPVLPGQIMAILQGPNNSKIGFWDGTNWYAYTIVGLDGQAIGLVRRGHDVLLVSQHRVLAITPQGQGVPLVPLSRSEGTVRSFRARTQPGAEHQPGDLPSLEVLKEPTRLAEPESNRATVDAPGFRARALDYELPGTAYRAFVQGAQAFLAISNSGVLQLPRDAEPRLLRSRSLVPEEFLQIATDPRRTVWLLGRDNHLSKFVNDRLRRVRLPAGNRAEAISTGPGGAYLVTTVTDSPNTLRVFVNNGRGWTQEAERTLTLPTELTAAPFAGVAPNGHVWVAIRVRREDGAGERMRGAVVIDPNAEAVIYHHRGADRAQGGLPLPDEINAIDFDTDNAWFASLSGLVRVGGSQAVVFGEARGVRGEVVSDVVVGSGIIWMAAAEGVGSYDRSNFDFNQSDVVQSARPTRLAIDLAGHLWASSRNGLVLHEGTGWTLLNEESGLPTNEIMDVQVDGAGRVWLLAEDRVMLLER